jgi:hypothetical protein
MFNRYYTFLLDAAIVLNAFMWGAHDFADRENSWNIWIFRINAGFLGLSLMEAVIKIIGQGLLADENTYLRDPMNCLDAIIILIGLIIAPTEYPHITTLRLFRVLLNSVHFTIFGGVKKLFHIFRESVWHNLTILIVLWFFIILSAILSLALWSGKIYDYCYKTETPPYNSTWLQQPNQRLPCGEYNPCANGYYCTSYLSYWRKNNLPIDQTLLDTQLHSEAKHWGFVKFDHIGLSMMQIFQATTLENWGDLVMILGVFEIRLYSAVYLLIVVIVCSIFIANLSVAVMIDNYLRLKEQEEQKSLILSNQHLVSHFTKIDPLVILTSA